MLSVGHLQYSKVQCHLSPLHPSPATPWHQWCIRRMFLNKDNVSWHSPWVVQPLGSSSKEHKHNTKIQQPSNTTGKAQRNKQEEMSSKLPRTELPYWSGLSPSSLLPHWGKYPKSLLVVTHTAQPIHLTWRPHPLSLSPHLAFAHLGQSPFLSPNRPQTQLQPHDFICL